MDKFTEQKKIIVLEGLPASGKTSISNYLRDNFNFVKVNEALGQLGDGKPVTNQIAIFQETIERYSLAKAASGAVVIDRGYPSLLAWDYCSERMNLAKNLDEKKAWVKEALDRGDLFEPDLYIYLISDPAISLQRRPRPQINEDVWSGIEGMNYYTEFCTNFFQLPEISKRIVKVDASLPIDVISKTIVQHAFQVELSIK